MIYYNEFDPFAAAWLGQLMKAGLIPKGDIDTRSITEVKPDEIRHYNQCHFFAGIGGWPEALRLAGWETDRNVWTGSCPCQPFSSAGNQKGKQDERHLWPVWFNLIRECRPATIFGEQVASAIAHGWLDAVYQGLEAEGYAVGAAVLPACSVGAPHKRDRLWFVANATDNRLQWRENTTGETRGHGIKPDSRDVMANTEREQEHKKQQKSTSNEREWAANVSSVCGMDLWQNGIWIDCPDGKKRIVEPGIHLLANRVQNRVGKLRGYGNAIVPQVAAEFIAAYDEARRGWQ